jgi:excisionase family DNA binding protein
MMETFDDIKRPTKAEQKAAMKSYSALAASISGLSSKSPEIEIEETHEKIRIPLKALKLLAKILKATSEGLPISVLPIATELTTQSAAELLGCSRPHFVKLLNEGKIPFTKIGRHRRVLLEDVMKYKKEQKELQKRLIIEIMKADEETGLYDS